MSSFDQFLERHHPRSEGKEQCVRNREVRFNDVSTKPFLAELDYAQHHGFAHDTRPEVLWSDRSFAEKLDSTRSSPGPLEMELLGVLLAERLKTLDLLQEVLSRDVTRRS